MRCQTALGDDLEEPVEAATRIPQRPELMWRATREFVERAHLMVSIRKLVKVNQGAHLEMGFRPIQYRGGAGIQVAIDVDNELVMLRHLKAPERVLEPAHFKRNALIIDARWSPGRNAPAS